MNREFMIVCGTPVNRNIWNHTIIVNSERKIIGTTQWCQVKFWFGTLYCSLFGAHYTVSSKYQLYVCGYFFRMPWSWTKILIYGWTL